jgi:GT2 family glycosyltransferase
MSNFQVLRKVSVAILTSNRRDELRRTLRGLIEEGPIWREIIVADNGSADGTQSMLKEEFPDVQLIETGGNIGVAGINQAYRSATGEWILSLDDDSCPDLGTWGPLCAELEKENSWAAITCSVKSGRTDHVRATQEPVLQPYLGFHQAGGLLRRSAIETLGGFDEDLFLWGVELHLAARAALAELKLERCDSAVVIHRSVPANRSNRRHAFHYCRNLFLLLLRYAPRASAQSLITDFLSNVIANSALHRTTIYMKAVREARSMFQVRGPRTPLSEEQFSALCPDLRAPFSYLG